MKTLLILFTLSLPFNANLVDQSGLIKIRNLIIEAAESKKANRELKTLLASYEHPDALIKGYKAASLMIEGKHMFNPLSRWNKFKEGKQLMEESIKADAKNYELRFLRFSIQTHIPPVLGYSSEIEVDKSLLINGLIGIKDKDLKTRVLNFLLASKASTQQDLIKLKQWKNK